MQQYTELVSSEKCQLSYLGGLDRTVIGVAVTRIAVTRIAVSLTGIAWTGMIAVTGIAVTGIAVTGIPAVTGPHIRRYWLNNRDLGTENVWRVAPREVTPPPPGDMVMQ